MTASLTLADLSDESVGVYANVEVQDPSGDWFQIPPGRQSEQALARMPESMERTKRNGAEFQRYLATNELLVHGTVVPLKVRIKISIQGERTVRTLSL